MVEPRNIGIGIILCILTCGIYYLYWIYAVTNEIGHLNDDPSFVGGTTILFGILTCGIYFWFWYYQLGRQIEILQESRGVRSSNDGIMFVVLAVFGFGIVSIAIAQSNLNEVV